MHSLTIRYVLGVGLVFGVLACWGYSQAAPKTEEFMRAKLKHSQNVLEALALEDFPGIAKNAEQMKLLSLDSNWQVMQTIEYVQHSEDFRRSCTELAKAAEAKRLDGAVLAYFQLTQNCVNCHKYVRKMKHADGRRTPE